MNPSKCVLTTVACLVYFPLRDRLKAQHIYKKSLNHSSHTCAAHARGTTIRPDISSGDCPPSPTRDMKLCRRAPRTPMQKPFAGRGSLVQSPPRFSTTSDGADKRPDPPGGILLCLPKRFPLPAASSSSGSGSSPRRPSLGLLEAAPHAVVEMPGCASQT